MGSPDHTTRRAFLGKGLMLTGATLAGPAVLAACGGTSGGGGGTSTKLTVGVATDLTNWDPFLQSFTNWPLMRNAYDALLAYDSHRKPVPRIAQSWKISSDQSSVTVKLRPGVKFQSGKPVTADAVVKNLQRAQDPKTASNMIGYVAATSGAEAADSSTVRIEFAKPSPTEIITDVLESLPIIDPASFDNLKSQGVGSGPFKYGEWAPGDHYQITKYDGFWDVKLPKLSTLTFRVFNDVDSMVSGLQSGSVDMIFAVPPSYASKLKSGYDLLLGTPGALTYEFKINTKHAPFGNKLVRQGLQYAVNREAIVKKVLYGFSQPTVLPWGPDSPAFDKSLAAKYPFDLQKAKQLFSAGGAPTWSSSILNLNSDPVMVAYSQILQADLKKIGVDLKVDVVDTTTYTNRTYSGQFDLIVNYDGNLAKYPTWITLNSIYRTVNNPVYGGSPPAGYTAAIEAANTATTTETQQAAFKQIRDILLDESWVVNIAYNRTISAARKGLAGFAYSVEDYPLFENATLSK